MNYKEAGVDIEKGEDFADFIRKQSSSVILKSLGGFAGGIEIPSGEFKEPVLFSCTDGVGTKLLTAKGLKKYDTIGIDLVAMCVNDLIVCGAKPLVFLDYIACGGIQEEILQQVIKGIIKGCEQAESTLAGGETAEMPDMYAADDIDLAGFSVGMAEKSEILPKKDQMEAGDPVYGIVSSGIHSNGLSLARKVLDKEGRQVQEELLTPTRIYVKEVMAFVKAGLLSGAAHITGGGLEANLQRALPDHLKPKLNWNWPVPRIFTLIQEKGQVEEAEMRRVFNMGIGMALVFPKSKQEQALDFSLKQDIKLIKIGELVNG